MASTAEVRHQLGLRMAKGISWIKGDYLPVKPILCIDFDGVVHRYSKGWQDGKIYDDVTDGFFEWAADAQQHFKLVIYSSRSKDPEQRTLMAMWLHEQRNKWIAAHGPADVDLIEIEFASEKPPAWLTIDDRCIKFEGRWDWLRSDILRRFKPWNAPDA
jgi:hypothetical protein